MSRRPSLTGPEQTREAKGRSRGQTLAEFGITISLLIVLILGIFQVGYLIYQQYIAINLAREGANLALRETSLDVVEAAIRSARPDFDADTKLSLSVVQLGPPGGCARGDNRRSIERVADAREKRIALVYVGIFLVPILLCTGLAIDLGRGYLVRVALAKAVDAAALAAARNITADSATATAVANNLCNANFPPGFLGVSSVQNPPELKFEIGSDGSHIIRVFSTATLPTTFMRMAKFDTLTVAADATATRRLVDMSFVIDRSGSLQGAFSDVKAAAMQFVGYFDTKADRIALITFSSGTTVAEPMGSARGFDLAQIDADIAATNPNGETATAEALYQAWDQLRAVPYGRQSGLRIAVVLPHGTPNSFPRKVELMSPIRER